MSTKKHSAGPWRHSDEDGQPIRGKHRKFPICYMDTGDTMNDADIRLICAAPALLALAKNALSYLPRQEYLQACAIIAEAENDAAALDAAKAYDLTEVTTDPEWENSVSKRIVHIEDAEGSKT